jgi:cyclic pyranopterin phosphate synthase
MTIAYRGKSNIYLNITNRCTCDCLYCIGRFRDGVFGYDLRLDSEPPLAEILHELERAFLDGEAESVVFAGLGEPTLRLDEVLGVIEWLHLRRIRSRLDTNGLGQLANPEVDLVSKLAEAGLDAVSISLVAHNPEVYNQVCRPVFSKAYREVLRFGGECVDRGISTELTVVDQPEVDIESCRSIALRMGAGFRVRPLEQPGKLEEVD